MSSIPLNPISISRSARIICLAVGCALHSAGSSASPPEAITPAAVAVQHQKLVSGGEEPAELLRAAQHRWQQNPASLDAAARLLVALDEPSLRKKNLDEVVEAADRVIARVATSEMSAEERTVWVADALYRKGRALGYMELPDVLEVRSIDDPQRHDEQFESTFKQLDALVDTTRPEFILLRIRRERRRGEYKEALRLLEIYREKAPDPRWYEKKRSDLLRESAAAAQ